MITSLRVRLFLSLAAAALLQGCIYLPRTTEVYDAKCAVRSHYMVLEPHYFGGFPASCGGKECMVRLATVGAISATSVVVSGSIVVVGNTVYWLEKRASAC
jgi:hypothetical protein